jgi:hypothetical protein
LCPAVGLVNAALYYKVFCPDVPIDKIPVDDEELLWRVYAEPIGPIDAWEATTWAGLTEVAFGLAKNEGNSSNLEEEVATRVQAPDTLAYNISCFASATASSKIDISVPPGAENEPFELLRNQHPLFVNAPLVRPVAYGSGTETEWGWHFESLLDACYLMLAVDAFSGRRLFQCPWCGRLNRLQSNSPHNALYCPPTKRGEPAGSCADQATKWKYSQRRSWNRHLQERYQHHLTRLKDAWGIDAQESPGEWKLTGKHSILHPIGLRNRGPLPPAACDDYKRWRASLGDDARHSRILHDKGILSLPMPQNR